MSFIQGKTIYGLGEYSSSQAVEHSSRGIWDKIEFYRELEEAMGKQHDWLGDQGFPHKVNRSCFLR